MKRSFSVGISLMMLSLSALAQSVAPAPSLLNFQGRLAKPDGTPVANGTYSVQFSLYDALTAGTQKWTQTLANVTVKNGTFAVLLSGFAANTFNNDLYLEIKIGTDAPLAPRQQLVSVAFALKANTVPDGSITNAKVTSGIDFAKLTNVPDTILKLPYAANINSASSLFSVYNTGTGYALLGQNSGGTSAVRGAASNGGIGVDASSDTSYAVYAKSTSGTGVHGVSESTDLAVLRAGVVGEGSRVGVYGNSISGVGVYGQGDGTGVHGQGHDTGVFGATTYDYGTGVLGTSYKGHGVYGGTSEGVGVYGNSTLGGIGVYGYSTNNYGVYGAVGTTGSPAAIYGKTTNNIGNAGYFVGNVYVTGTLTWGSDARYKSNIQPIGDALQDILALRGVTYEYKRDQFADKSFPAGKQVGLIAQEVEKVLPELVRKDKDGYLALDYAHLTPVLIEAIKAQQKQIDAQGRQLAEMAELKAQLAALTTAFREMKAETERSKATHKP